MSMEWRMCVAVDSVCPENKPSTLHCQDAAAPLQSTALETVGPINELVVKFSNGLGRAITSVSADDNEEQFIFQRLPIALQRFNVILLHESYGGNDDPDL